MSFKHYRPVEVLADLSIVERVDAHTIRFVGEDTVPGSAFRVVDLRTLNPER